MTPTHTITPEWRQWLRENLQRGCSTASLYEALIAGGIAAETARAELDAFAKVPLPVFPQQRAAYVPLPSRIAYQAQIVLPDRTVHIGARLKQPDVVVLLDLLGAEECEALIELSRQKLQRSTVVNPQTGALDVIQDRSSFGTYFSLGENDLVSRLEARIAALTGVPIAHGEGLQILHYEPGGEYRPHHDYFPPTEQGSASHLARGGQRIATLILYLNDVASGGETLFPSAGQLAIVPRRGSAVYFAYCDSAGQLDPATLHAGAPVAAGEKWIATKWLRQRPLA